MTALSLRVYKEHLDDGFYYTISVALSSLHVHDIFWAFLMLCITQAFKFLFALVWLALSATIIRWINLTCLKISALWPQGMHEEAKTVITWKRTLLRQVVYCCVSFAGIKIISKMITFIPKRLQNVWLINISMRNYLYIYNVWNVLFHWTIRFGNT